MLSLVMNAEEGLNLPVWLLMSSVNFIDEIFFHNNTQRKKSLKITKQ